MRNQIYNHSIYKLIFLQNSSLKNQKTALPIPDLTLIIFLSNMAVIFPHSKLYRQGWVSFFPVRKISFVLIQKCTLDRDRCAAYRFVAIRYRHGVAAFFQVSNLADFEAVSTVLANQLVAILHIIAPAGVIADLAGVQRRADGAVRRFHGNDFHFRAAGLDWDEACCLGDTAAVDRHIFAAS